MKQRESVCSSPNTATSTSLHPQKSKLFLSPLSLSVSRLSVHHVCFSPSVSGAPLSLSPSPPHSAVKPFFYLIFSLTHVLHSLSLSVSCLSLSLCFRCASLSPLRLFLPLTVAASPPICLLSYIKEKLHI